MIGGQEDMLFARLARHTDHFVGGDPEIDKFLAEKGRISIDPMFGPRASWLAAVRAIGLASGNSVSRGQHPTTISTRVTL